MAELNGVILAIAGGIGAGKTTLGDLLAKRMGAEFYQEPLVPSLLKQFLDDQRKYAYAFQLYMLTRRQLNYALAKKNRKANINTVIDRTLRCDKVFADLQNKSGHISDDELKVYNNVYNDFMRFKPDIVLYLDVSVDVAMDRIKSRNRDGESTYTREYLIMLINEYEIAMKELEDNGITVCRLDWNSHMDLTDEITIQNAIDDVMAKIYELTV